MVDAPAVILGCFWVAIGFPSFFLIYQVFLTSTVNKSLSVGCPAYPLPGQMKKSVLATDKGALCCHFKKIDTILIQADS